MRTHPNSYIMHLEEMISQFKGMVLYRPNEVPLRTNEGPGAVQDCINFLRSTNPIYSLQWEDNMAKAAGDLANDICPKGNFFY